MLSHGNLSYSLLQSIVIATEVAKVDTVKSIFYIFLSSRTLKFLPSFLLDTRLAHVRGLSGFTRLSPTAPHLRPACILFPNVPYSDDSGAPTTMECGPRAQANTKVCDFFSSESETETD
jgi:hypothetical protein